MNSHTRLVSMLIVTLAAGIFCLGNFAFASFGGRPSAFVFMLVTPSAIDLILNSIIPALIPLFTPMLVSLIKLKIIPALSTNPKIKWIIVVLTPLIGVGLTALGNWLTALDVQLWQGALLGALGVFVRELYDQLRKAVGTPELPAPNP